MIVEYPSLQLALEALPEKVVWFAAYASHDHYQDHYREPEKGKVYTLEPSYSCRWQVDDHI